MIWFSGFGRQTQNGARNLFLTVASLTIASLIGFIYLYPINQSAAYFLMPTRFWEMATGCLIFLLFQKWKSIEQFLEKFPPLLAIALIVGIMYLPMSWATASTVAVVTLSAMLIASLKKGKASYIFFTNPKVVYIGLISYSLYLWHWGILSISRWTIGIHWWSLPFQVTLIFGLAIASYQYIETPLRKGNWFRKRWKTLLAGIGILITLSMNLVVLDKPLKGKLFLGNQSDEWNMKLFGETKITNSPLLPTIYLIGDSHAGHYGPVMTHLAYKKEFNFIMHPRGDELEILLDKKNNDAFVLAPLQEYKNNFKNGDIIIFASHVGKYKDKQNWTQQYETFIQQTQNISLKFILISPTPTFSGVKGGYTCKEAWFRPSWTISPLCFSEIKKSEWLASNTVPISTIEKFLLANTQVSSLDAFSVLCPDAYCRNYDKNSIIYKDNDHLTSYGSMKLINIIETFIRSQ